MDDAVEQFLRDGFVAVEDALDPAFCDDVVAERLGHLGIAEHDRSTWRTGWHNLPGHRVHSLAEVAPRAATVRDLLVGGADAVAFGDMPDNLILNFPEPGRAWWAPWSWDHPSAGWHKDGDWFRHFLDSPEQGLLGIVLWRDVTERQGATYLATDSVRHMARLLAAHPEGFDPPVPVADVLAACQDFRAVTGRRGTIIWAHPFMVHSASVNATDRLRIISNTTVMLRNPLRFAGAGPRTTVERAVLEALGVAELPFEPRRERVRIVPERERRWDDERTGHSPG